MNAVRAGVLWFAVVLVAQQALALEPPQAPQEQQAQPAALVAFTSDEGLVRLARANAKANFAALANQFEAQSNGAFCGPATAAIVLNAAAARSSSPGQEPPRDRSRLRPEDLQHLPPGADISVARFTQDNVLLRSRKTRAQVLGEPVGSAADGKPLRDYGFQLRQFDELLRANGLATRLRVAGDGLGDATIRSELIAHLMQPGGYVVVNYRREAVGQRGGGHISPLAAYDAGSDAFLVLDVNPSAAAWVWMPTATLVKGMRSFDTVENRGYVLVVPR